LQAAGADLNRVYFAGKSGDFDPATDMPRLVEAANGIGDVNLVIIDPIVSAVVGDSHKNAEVRRALQPVVDLAEHAGCAVIGITHLTKGTQGQDPIDRITGSLAFGAVARLAFLATREKKGGDESAPCRRVITRIKSNIGPDGGGFYFDLEQVELPSGITTSKVKWLGLAHGPARDIIGHAEEKVDEHQASALEEAGDFLRETLANGAMPATEIQKLATDVGITRGTLNRSKRKYGVRAAKLGKKGGNGQWVWYLPPDSNNPRYQGAHRSGIDHVDDLDRKYEQDAQADQDTHTPIDEYLDTLKEAPVGVVDEVGKLWVNV
jgi:hypothetical protein